ncbi:MAG: TorF family putative porin [Hyphomonadaceae bacterium]
MKKIWGAALLASAATIGFAGTANAEVEFTGNVALTSDYVFRGVSQSDSDIAIQGGMDLTSGIFYAGVWGSSIDFGTDGTVEVDLYGGVRPVVGPFTLDFGVIYYAYPGMDDSLEADMWEFRAGASVSPVEGLTLAGNVFYSPDFTFTNTLAADDASGLFVEGRVSYTVNDTVAISGAVGNQSVDYDDYFGIGEDNYTTWNVGGTLSFYGFGLDLRYYDSDAELFGPSGDETADGRFVATLSRAL